MFDRALPSSDPGYAVVAIGLDTGEFEIGSARGWLFDQSRLS
jgi:hypothetical protein